MHKFISHRGNLTGPNPQFENRPDYVLFALSDKAVHGCEIDVWNINGEWYLGHDKPLYRVTMDFLRVNNLWLHAKTNDTMLALHLNLPHTNYFWHTTDTFTITSRGYVWTCHKLPTLGDKSVWMCPNTLKNEPPQFCEFVCSDYLHL